MTVDVGLRGTNSLLLNAGNLPKKLIASFPTSALDKKNGGDIAQIEMSVDRIEVNSLEFSQPARDV